MADQEFEPLTIENAKVFRMNDTDDVAAPSEQIAKDWYDIHFGIEIENVTEQPLDQRLWVEGGPRRYKSSYRDEIASHIGCGFKQPFLIASTEY
jgi:hypothetical protein